MVEIRAFPRIHMGLLDLGHATLRSYGGLGFILNGLPTTIYSKELEPFEIVPNQNLDSNAVADLERLEQHLKRDFRSIKGRYEIVTTPKQHIGLGTKTAMLLGTLKCISISNKYNWSDNTIIKLSRRGGASGIGVNGFFSGGFLIDGGHPVTEDYSPSSARAPNEIPPVLLKKDFPSHWYVHLILPEGRRLAAVKEEDFFSKNTPIPTQEVLQSIALTYHGIATAFTLEDLDLLKNALDEFHLIGFKHRELKAQTSSVQIIFDKIRAFSPFPIGVSSLGPLLYVITPNNEVDVTQIIRNNNTDLNFQHLGIFSGRNSGYEVST